MNKVWLIFKREFLNRVQKKSFLIATILIPLIFPTIIGIMAYVFVKQEEGTAKEIIQVYDETGKMTLQDDSRFGFTIISGDFELLKEAFKKSDYSTLLHIPKLDLANPKGITLYSKENPSIRKTEELERKIEDRIHDLKLEEFNISKETLKSLKTDITLNNINSDNDGIEKDSNTGFLYGLGVILGILIYMFVLIYGMQIMLGVIDEKTSKVVEIIISSVRPFQLMMGKILGIAAVGLVQFAIWVILISVLTSATLSIFGMKMPQQQAMEQIGNNGVAVEGEHAAQNNVIIEIMKHLDEIPIGYIVYNFAFYFLGGYLLYGALFAAIGSAVDSQQEAQQFSLPVMLPLIVAYMSLFMFVLTDHSSTASFWFSIIPFTSPIAMVGRLGFGVPLPELILSQVLLVAGFIFTTWIASRIYRIGILTHGSKVSYKVLAKWFVTKM
jgi:ABC-2 type transport system permease protein